MVQLADDIGLHTVAEGVETAEQAVALRAIGCDGAQGFHYARPLPMAELLRWIAQHTSAGIPSPATPLDRPAATGHPATRH
jgi:EAL domain-containing protein (putative c-di-GMP-specific phosphodiesterase class I)